MKIMIGLPIHRPMEFKVFQSFISMVNRKSNIEYQFSMIQNSIVHDAREWIADQFIKSDCSHLMFIDSDMTFHPKSVEYLLRHEKDFVTAKAFKRVYPYQPCFYTKLEVEPEIKLESPVEYGEGLLPIEGAGMACVLISRKAFESIEKPYFFPLPQVGEDLSFCYKLKKAGIKMYCDTTIQFGHLAQVEILENDFQKALKKLNEENKTLVEVQT
jgi:hypothetical protein